MQHRFAALVTALVVVSFASVTWVAAVCSQELGRIYVAVTDEDGLPVTDLGPEEFRVAEEGGDAEIVSAEIGTEPMKIALLVDNGRRISRGQAINPLREAVTGFIEAIPPEHQIGLFTIGGPIVRRVDFTTDRAELLKAAQEIHAQADSVRFIDGVRETWERRFDGDEAWPVFVAILTDATEVSAFMNEDRYMGLINMLRFAGVVVHSVVWSSRGRELVQGSVPADFAINLSGNTGGRFASIAAATAFGATLRQLAADMVAHYDEASTRYRVLYERPDPSGESVSVRVTRPRVNLQLFGDLGLP